MGGEEGVGSHTGPLGPQEPTEPPVLGAWSGCRRTCLPHTSLVGGPSFSDRALHTPGASFHAAGFG